MKKKDYRIAKHNFNGDFTPEYIVDEANYRKKKLDYLMRFGERKQEMSNRARQMSVFRDKIIAGYYKQGKTQEEIAKILTNEFKYRISHQGVSLILKDIKLIDDLPLEGVEDGEAA